MLFWVGLFWYCYDDWLARLTNTPDVGTLNGFIWIVCLVLAALISE